MARVLMCFLLAACGACTAPLKDTAPPHETGPVTSLYLESHGWHVGLVIRQADIPVSAWPWGLDFPEAEYLEVGWGDRTFYFYASRETYHLLNTCNAWTAKALRLPDGRVREA